MIMALASTGVGPLVPPSPGIGSMRRSFPLIKSTFGLVLVIPTIKAEVLYVEPVQEVAQKLRLFHDGLAEKPQAEKC